MDSEEVPEKVVPKIIKKNPTLNTAFKTIQAAGFDFNTEPGLDI